MLTIGQQVPDFETPAFKDNAIGSVKLTDYKGKWVVLLFYPADFTFVCPTELAEAAAFHGDFQKEGAEILSVSTDTAYVHLAWKETSKMLSGVKYPMLADPTGKICREFGTYIEADGLSQRASFIIDPKGNLKYMEIHDNSIGRNTEEILRKLQAAKYTEEHPGEVCPANWHPGEDTIKPSDSLVGKL